ncbi:hypothetical protein JB92DRAFT_3309023 [Gautieria morchelliformis]|nr:hypothetical protein JB92DRAFT_3309023 [Gautieria morchelliformis]
MSGMRVNHLRALTVQRLAGAYNADEIAASVMVVQGTCNSQTMQPIYSTNPSDPNAHYEKIPSR